MNVPKFSDPRLDISWENQEALTTGHFQHLDRQQRYQRSVVENGYGVVHCSWDSAKLNELIFELTECDAIFRDGTHVVYPQNAYMVPVKLPKRRPGDSLVIYLTLPKLSDRQPNLASNSEDAMACNRRARPVNQLVSNEDLGPEYATELVFRQWTPALRLEEEMTDQQENIELVRITYDSLGKPQVDPASSGAILRLGANGALIRECQQLCEEIQQADRRSMSLMSRFAHSPVYVHLVLRRQTLARAAQRIGCLTDDSTHPKEMWKALTECLAELRSLSSFQSNCAVTKYDHAQAGRLLRSLLEQLRPFVEMDTVAWPFSTQAGELSIEFDSALWSLKKEAYLVDLKQSSDVTSNVTPMTDFGSLLLCAAGEIESMRFRRLAGYRLLEQSTSSKVQPLLSGHAYRQIDACTVGNLPVGASRWALASRTTAPLRDSFGLLFRL